MVSPARTMTTLTVLSLAACSSPNGGRVCPQVETISPLVQVAYPMPSASDVPTTPALVLYYVGNADGAVPLVLTSAGGSVTGTAATLPSPLPSPIASPLGAIPTRLYAASFSQFAAATSYAVRYDQTTQFCDQTTTAFVTAASFSTR